MPVTLDCYKRVLRSNVPQFAGNWLDENQELAAFASIEHPLFIVAGPGTGKTTVLTLRILYLIFVKSFLPQSIMATTFTRKAANELRSRILSWGNIVKLKLTEEYSEDSNTLSWLDSIDINSILTGTLDSIAEEAIENDRQPTEITPVIIENQLSNGLMRKHVLFRNGLHRNTKLKNAIKTIKNNPQIDTPRMISELNDLAERFLHDLVDIDSLADSSEENSILVQTVRMYWDYLSEKHLMDFALLEKEFLNRLNNGRLDSMRNLQAIFVDEFQDTNPLQEEIYYTLCEQTNSSLTVVGDDDQSIYRFRGATVEIFSQFSNRITSKLGPNWCPERKDLIKNFRSTAKIVDFSTTYIKLDSDYQSARAPDKKTIIPINSRHMGYDGNMPVLGMFRESAEELSESIANFLYDIFEGNGFDITVGNEANGEHQNIKLTKGDNGDWGDSVLLSYSANDFSGNRERLPHYLRNTLEKRGVNVFNPRGRTIIDITEVRICLGILLLCIDNDGSILDRTFPRDGWAREARCKMEVWKEEAQSFIGEPTTPDHDKLAQFVQDWAQKKASGAQSWPDEWPLVELLFTTMKWIPLFQDNPEGQIYLEVLARTITIASNLSSFSGNVFFNDKYHEASIKDILREVMLPIANGEVEVDEEIMPNVPRNYFTIMTIHQAKGLEFPLTIVDVGSDFRTNHHQQRRFRYPTEGNSTHSTESQLAPYSQIGSLRTLRTDIQRAFDDLRRLYFVSYTRAQNILLLVGHIENIKENNLKLIQCGYVTNDNSCRLNFIDRGCWTCTEANDVIMLI